MMIGSLFKAVKSNQVHMDHKWFTENSRWFTNRLVQDIQYTLSVKLFPYCYGNVTYTLSNNMASWGLDFINEIFCKEKNVLILIRVV